MFILTMISPKQENTPGLFSRGDFLAEVLEDLAVINCLVEGSVQASGNHIGHIINQIINLFRCDNHAAHIWFQHLSEHLALLIRIHLGLRLMRRSLSLGW